MGRKYYLHLERIIDRAWFLSKWKLYLLVVNSYLPNIPDDPASVHGVRSVLSVSVLGNAAGSGALRRLSVRLAGSVAAARFELV